MMRIAMKSLILGATLMGSGMTNARAADTGYVATLEAPARQDRIVAHGLFWRCAGARCVAPAGNSRPAIVCEALAKAAGSLMTFASTGGALDATQLERCNRHKP